jgi:hypothetical protein
MECEIRIRNSLAALALYAQWTRKAHLGGHRLLCVVALHNNLPALLPFTLNRSEKREKYFLFKC